jgi:hypothetical protein
MKKYAIIIPIVVFITCVAFGWLLADKSNGLASSAPAPYLNAQSSDTQFNMVMIHVDDLSKEDPSLVSVWGLFMATHDHPGLIFKPFYPSNLDAKVSEDLAKSFSVTPEKAPSQKFLEKLYNATNFSWNSYVLVDDTAVKTLDEWLAGNSADSISPVTTRYRIEEEDAIVQNFCDQFAGLLIRENQPQWTSLIPNHLRTDFSLESFLTRWEKLTTAPNPPQCKVLRTE